MPKQLHRARRARERGKPLVSTMGERVLPQSAVECNIFALDFPFGPF